MRNRWQLVLLLVSVCGVASGALSADAPPSFRAGVATRVITPKANLWMGGYGARTHPATGTTQDLYAKALALADGEGGRFVFITIDAIAITRVVRKEVAERLAQSHRLQAHEFVITASHTHSGPEYRAGRVPPESAGAEDAARDYLTLLQTTLAAMAGEALDSMAPARLSYAHARAGFAMNRRLPRNGDFINAPNPDGPVDTDVPVLRVDGADGKLRAVLFGYACHNTTLTQTSYKYCGDYAGFAQHYLQEAHPGAVALFMTGCGGDQNPYPRSTLVLAQAHGRTLATAVEAALDAKSRTLSGRLRSTYAETDLRYASVPARAEYETQLKSKEAQVAAHAGRMLARLEKEGTLPASYPYPVQVIHFGSDLKLVALGGEAVVDYSLRLKRELAGSATVWIAAYSNDVMGYIPTERVLREGGYEGLQASRIGSLHPSPWAPGLEDQIISKVHELQRAVEANKR